MPQYELAPMAQQWVNVVLLWIGFGTLVGLMAKALLPGRQPAGSVGTLLIGIAGSVLGPLVLTFLVPQDRFNPISPVGFIVAIGGAVVLLAIYRIGATWFGASEEEPPEI